MLQGVLRKPEWLSMYLCGWGLSCLEPLVFQQLQMRQPSFDPALMPEHSCACCCEEPGPTTVSVLTLRRMLFLYRSRPEPESRDCSSLNVFSGKGAHHIQQTCIITRALRVEFAAAAWPCPKNLPELANIIIRTFSMHVDSPLSFQAEPADGQAETLVNSIRDHEAQAQMQASASPSAAAASSPASTSASSTPPAPASSAGLMPASSASPPTGVKLAASLSTSLPERQRIEWIQRTLTPLVSGTFPASAAALSKAADPEGKLHHRQQKFLADLRAVYRLAQIHTHTRILAGASKAMLSWIYLPFGFSLQLFSMIDLDDLEAASIELHKEDRGLSTASLASSLLDAPLLPIQVYKVPACSTDATSKRSCADERDRPQNSGPDRDSGLRQQLLVDEDAMAALKLWSGSRDSIRPQAAAGLGAVTSSIHEPQQPHAGTRQPHFPSSSANGAADKVEAGTDNAERCVSLSFVLVFTSAILSGKLGYNTGDQHGHDVSASPAEAPATLSGPTHLQQRQHIHADRPSIAPHSAASQQIPAETMPDPHPSSDGRQEQPGMFRGYSVQ